MTVGFIDLASINSALGVLKVGKSRRWPLWDRHSIMKVSYLLMHDNIHVLPSVKSHNRATGLYDYVIEAFPHLESYKFLKKNLAERNTKVWLSKNQSTLARIWNEVDSESNFAEWARFHKEQFFVSHVKNHGSLFEGTFIPYIAPAIGCSEKDLEEILSLSNPRNIKLIARWEKSDIELDEVKLPYKSWLLAGIIRGKYHEYLADAEGMQLSSHPFRKKVERKLKTGQFIPATNSENYFTRMLIGSAALEISSKRRIKTWVDNIANTRKAIALGRIALPNTLIESDAERHAADAAKIVGLPSSPAILRRGLDVTVSYGIPTFVGLMVAPWDIALGGLPIGAVIQQGYRHKKNSSLGDDLAKLALSTRRRFRKLARDVPGRIEQNLLEE